MECQSKNGESEDGKDANPEKGGNEEVQNLLADLAQLQGDKVRVSEFVEEKSRLLSGIVDSAKEGYERISENAKRRLDERSDQVTAFMLSV